MENNSFHHYFANLLPTFEMISVLLVLLQNYEQIDLQKHWVLPMTIVITGKPIGSHLLHYNWTKWKHDFTHGKYKIVNYNETTDICHVSFLERTCIERSI